MKQVIDLNSWKRREHYSFFKDYQEPFFGITANVDCTKAYITTMNIDENSGRLDVIHYSTIPWISFTALTHERNFTRPDSIPKITFGKYFKENNRLLLPLSVNGHHGLMDGMHAGLHFEIFQQLLNED